MLYFTLEGLFPKSVGLFLLYPIFSCNHKNKSRDKLNQEIFGGHSVVIIRLKGFLRNWYMSPETVLGHVHMAGMQNNVWL
jgi:hypothetical protein